MKISKKQCLEDITDDIFNSINQLTEETLEAGEVWVNDNVPGVKAMMGLNLLIVPIQSIRRLNH